MGKRNSSADDAEERRSGESDKTQRNHPQMKMMKKMEDEEGEV
jgi:hypothetical protein